MFAANSSFPIGIYGPEEPATAESRGCSLWPIGYAGTVTAAGGTPVIFPASVGRQRWRNLLEEVRGVVWTGRLRSSTMPTSDEMHLSTLCRKQRIPLLAVDEALLALNAAFGGTTHTDLARERPEALQHRHPPEKGLRHAIVVNPGSRLSLIYGEGELAVNSEHRCAVNRVAKGFRVSALALDGIIEAIEYENENWFAMGVQWRPASASASGLDIQIFRGLLDACEQHGEKGRRLACTSAA